MNLLFAFNMATTDYKKIVCNLFFCDFYATDCNMKPKKDINIYDIALKQDLSSATVSRALQDKPAINKNTRKKIQAVRSELIIRKSPLKNQNHI
jgi:hypothetical protein